MQIEWTEPTPCAQVLAKILMDHVHGHRPVTLIGFSMGARLIMQCLQHLAEAGPAGHGIVETAVLMGTPFSADRNLWDKAGSVCAHRLVNVYCNTDWVLGLAYRASSFNREVSRMVALGYESNAAGATIECVQRHVGLIGVAVHFRMSLGLFCHLLLVEGASARAIRCELCKSFLSCLE